MTSESADVAEMKRLLKYANYQKVGTALGVSRTAVSEWARGNDVSPKRVEQVRALLSESLGRRKSPPQSFDWDGLMAKMDSIAREVATLREETVAARLARLAVADVAGQPPPDGAAASTGPDEPDQAQSEPTAPHGQ